MIKPSEIRFDTSFPPLVGTLGRTEREAAASLLILACQHHGDVWQPITVKQIGEALRAAVEAGRQPFTALNSNPFWRPDFHDLVAQGFAAGDLSVGTNPLTLSEVTIEIIARKHGGRAA
jgi:hypothetical protein